jgi:NarL family two-component system response regulator YdfI
MNYAVILSRRELQIIKLVSAGKQNKAIAIELGLSVHTVGTHLRSIYAKLGVDDRAHAVALCFHQRILKVAS